MNILITLDYELFFGSQTGSVERCIISPTEQLLRIAEKYHCRFSFFVDSGYLIKLQELSHKHPQLKKDYEYVIVQLKKIAASGHDIQLHIHPHWEDCSYDGSQWIMNVKRYKLSDFSKEHAADIIKKHTAILKEIRANKISVYRAGGWCAQPWTYFSDALKAEGIIADSSVFPGGYNRDDNYNYDFRSAPIKSNWKFSDNPAKENINGDFIEFPISSLQISPVFFWKLFVLGRLNPADHKPMGDGFPVAHRSDKFKLLTRNHIKPVSVDGYFASLLNKALKNSEKKNFTELVIMGHPKAFTRYSLKKLEDFIQQNYKKHSFVNYSEILKTN